MAFPKKDPKDKHRPQMVSFPPQLLERLIKFCEEDEMSISWVVQKAVDKWLTERGY